VESADASPAAQHLSSDTLGATHGKKDLDYRTHPNNAP
jgi:hypothetical protein